MLISPKKKPGESKLKKLKVQNKQLKDLVRKLREIVSTDKNLKNLKAEFNDCMTDCKNILEHLENKI